jgi:hypothetical protein
VPADRASVLKHAFAAVLKDAGLIEEAHKAGLSVEPVSAEEAESILRKAFDTDPAVVETIRKAMGR